MPFSRLFPMIVIMSVKVLLSLEISDTINVSSLFILVISRPNFLPVTFFFPLTISETHWSTDNPF